ncbi:hypothetical protein WJX77_007517 [Trebouxia sp. C0004]
MSASESQEGSWDQTAVLIDVFSGKHKAILPKTLLNKRKLTWHPQYGWIFDVWVDSAYDHALSGPHGRFAVPHLLRNMRILAKEVVVNVLLQH